MRSLIEQHMGRCSHFTGIDHETCKAGIRYDDVRAEPNPEKAQGWSGARWPCQAEIGADLPCPCRQFPTLEEAKAYEQGVVERIEFMITAKRRIRQQKEADHCRGGIIECPKCSGKLHYSIASSNGHVHARCETPHCLAWME